MGGNRVSAGRWVLNVAFVWILTGLWHGAAWNFVIWGFYYAVLLIIEKGLDNGLSLVGLKVPNWIRWIPTIFLVMLGWAIFMSDGHSVPQMWEFIGRLFHSVPLENKVTIVSMNLFGYLPYVVLGVLISFPSGIMFEQIGKRLNRIHCKTYAVIHDVVQVSLLIMCIVFIIGGSYNPFLYYRF